MQRLETTQVMYGSILTARELIVSGSILKVGNGVSINIWDDPWIPEIGCTKIQTAKVQGLEEAKVRSLMSMDQNEWDREILRDIFVQEDIEKILKIPVPLTNQDDKWIWLEDSKGQYMVKSGYKVLTRDVAQRSMGSPSFN